MLIPMDCQHAILLRISVPRADEGACISTPMYVREEMQSATLGGLTNKAYQNTAQVERGDGGKLHSRQQ